MGIAQKNENLQENPSLVRDVQVSELLTSKVTRQEKRIAQKILIRLFYDWM